MKSMKCLYNKNGFTLMEVIIVLVILAILAALLIPSLSGYVDKADESTTLVECRHFVTAAQVVATEWYADRQLREKLAGIEDDYSDFLDECFELSDIKRTANHRAYVSVSEKGKILSVDYTDGYYTAVYKNGDFTVLEGVKTDLINGAHIFE